MKATETNFYTSAACYVEGCEAMRNEVTMLYVAGALILQELARQSLPAEPYGGIGQHIGTVARSKLREISVLDVCCGPGNVGNYLALILPKLQLTGIDKNTTFIEAARRKFADLDWDFIVADARSFDLNRSFHFVTGSSAYHHIEDEFKVGFLECIKRHLLPDGRVILCENFLPTYTGDAERARAVNRYYAELEEYFLAGNGTAQAMAAIEEVRQLELSKEEEHKVRYEVFESHVRMAGLEVERMVATWQPPHLAEERAGSYVICLRHRSTA